LQNTIIIMHFLQLYYLLCFIDAPVIDVGVTNETLKEGDTAFFTCQATGAPIPKISWYFNGAPLETTNTVKYMISEMSLNPATKNNTLKIIDVDSSDIGKYTCNATNVVSSDTSSGILAVSGEFVSQLLKCFYSVCIPYAF